MRRLYLNILTFLIFSSLSFISIHHVQAAAFRNGKTVTIPKGEVITESLYIGGNTITIDGDIEGDIFCGGQNVRIAGTINGDVICGAQSLNIIGHVTGDVRAAGQTVQVEGTIDHNANLFGQHVQVSSGSAILGEANIWAQDMQMDGSIARKLSGGGQSVTINGTVTDVDIQAETLTVGSSAQIKHNLVYVSEEKAKIENSGAVQGTIVKKEPPKNQQQQQEQRNQGWRTFWSVARVFSVIAQILLACIVIYFIPKRMHEASKAMMQNIWPTIGWGLLVLFLTPLIIILFIITIIGIPLSIIALFLFIFSFFIARILVAMVVGRRLLEQFWAQQKENDFWATALGLIVLWIIFSVPVIGGLISFIVLIWGLGGVYYMFRPMGAPAAKKSQSSK